MTARLVRALYKGGVTAPVSPDAWGVWRSQDRRGRVIGRLVDRDIERLQLRGHLKSVGEGDAALIWSGPPIDETGDVDGASHIAQRDPIARAASTYVEQLILKQSAPAFREALRRAVQAFRQDMQAAPVSSAALTMNWERLHMREKSTRSLQDRSFVRSPAQHRARANLGALERAMTRSDFNFLTHLLCADASKAWLARHHNLRVSLVESKALKVLRILTAEDAPTR